MTSSPVAGLIVPPAHGRVPVHGPEMFGDRLQFIGAGLGLAGMSIAGYDAVIDKVGELTELLVQQGAEAVSLMGTSLSFYKGVPFNSQLTDIMAAASGGRPVTTMSTSIVEALNAVECLRPVVTTAYTDQVNDRLNRFLLSSGFAPVGMAGMGVVDTGAAQRIPTSAVTDVCERVVVSAQQHDRSFDGILISCGALDTLGLLGELEQEYGVPVVASSPAGFWSIGRLLAVAPSNVDSVLFKGSF